MILPSNYHFPCCHLPLFIYQPAEVQPGRQSIHPEFQAMVAGGESFIGERPMNGPALAVEYL